MTTTKFTDIVPPPKDSHADESSRELTVAECKKLCNFACAAVGAKPDIYNNRLPAYEEVQTEKLKVYEQLGLATKIQRECFDSIALHFLSGIGADLDRFSSKDHPVITLGYSLIPSTTKEIDDAIAKVSERHHDEDAATFETLKDEGATHSDIDAVLKKFTDHIHSQILSNKRQIS